MNCPKCKLIMKRCDFLYCPDCGERLEGVAGADRRLVTQAAKRSEESDGEERRSVDDRGVTAVEASSSRPIVTCGCCLGKGRVELGRAEWSTLKRLRASKTPKRAKDLIEKDRQVTAINNRLVALEEHGLARRVGKDGRYWLWENVAESRKPESGADKTKRPREPETSHCGNDDHQSKNQA